MKNLMNISTKFLLVLFLLGFTACGGGGGGGAATPTNVAPVANAGVDQDVYRAEVVSLVGSASSDANGDSLTYSWAFTSKPATSTATLSGSTVANPTFTADVDGSYVLSLVVNDGSLNSSADSVTITATHQQAIASLTLVGGTDTIGSLTFDLVLPAGFSLVTNAGDLATGVLTVNIASSLVATNYLPETTLDFGQLTVGIIKDTGFAPGAFATLVHDLAQGETLPLNNAFNPILTEVVDLATTDLTSLYSIEVNVQQRTAIP